jgi:hypothetical protein
VYMICNYLNGERVISFLEKIKLTLQVATVDCSLLNFMYSF